MSMSKYTPGPWVKGDETWEGDGAAGVLVTTELGDCVAFCTTWTDRGQPGNAQASDYANANLIASAPELLQTLIEVTACLAWNAHGECRGINDGPILSSSDAVEMAKKAITKARCGV